MNLKKFRQDYPEYDDLSDEDVMTIADELEDEYPDEEPDPVPGLLSEINKTLAELKDAIVKVNISVQDNAPIDNASILASIDKQLGTLEKALKSNLYQ